MTGNCDPGGNSMSMLVRFSPASLTSDKYDQVMRALEEGGHWPPDGLELHVCFGAEGAMKVSEIWASKEQFEAFGERLMPLLDRAGITFSAPPELLDVHRQERF
jgi:hypothetical protein